MQIPKKLLNEWKLIGEKASKKAKKHEKILSKYLKKLGWFGWSISNKFKKDFPPGYNLTRNAIIGSIEKTKTVNNKIYQNT